MNQLIHFREAIKILGPDKCNKSIQEWLLDTSIWSKLRQKGLNGNQVSLLYFSTKLTDQQPSDAVNTFAALDVTLASIFLSFTKPIQGWRPKTQEALCYMRTVKNTVYSHTNKCWISDDVYSSLETSINAHINVILADEMINFGEMFRKKIEDWLSKSKELMTSRDDVLKYLQGEMKHDLVRIKEDQMLLLDKTEEQTGLLKSLIEAKSNSIGDIWNRLKEDSWRRYKNPLFNNVTLLGPLKRCTLTLMDLWQELEVSGNGWLSGQISLVCERFLKTTRQKWCIEGTGASGKTCFLKKLCVQAEVYNPEKLILFIDKSSLTEGSSKNMYHGINVLSTLINLGVFGTFNEAEKRSVEHCLRQYSDNILFLFDGEEMDSMVTAAAQLKNSKIITTCRGKADHNIRSLILGISSAGRNSLLHRCLINLLGSYNIETHLPKLRQFCGIFTGNEVQSLAKHAIFIQFISVLYFERHCNTSAVQHFLSRQDVMSDLVRSLLVKDGQSRTIGILEDYLCHCKK